MFGSWWESGEKLVRERANSPLGLKIVRKSHPQPEVGRLTCMWNFFLPSLRILPDYKSVIKKAIVMSSLHIFEILCKLLLIYAHFNS